jgi:terminase large subunit-like protein
MLTRTLRAVNLRKIDGRSQVGVALRRVRQDLLDHLGGEDQATVPERILCDEIAKLRVITSAIGTWLMERETLATPSGELLPAVEAHARLVNVLAKTLKQLGMRRAAREVTVAEQLQALHASRESDRHRAPMKRDAVTKREHDAPTRRTTPTPGVRKEPARRPRRSRSSSHATLADPRLLDDVVAFAEAFGGIELFPWQKDAFGAACRRDGGRFVHRLAGISVARGQGKSWAMSLVAVWRLIAGPAPQDIISAALDTDGARVVLEHAKRIIRGSEVLSKAIEIRSGELLVPTTGSRWTITSREHLASRGRHPTLVLYDEAGWSRDDELFSSLLAGQASVDDPLMLVCSTVGKGRPGRSGPSSSCTKAATRRCSGSGAVTRRCRPKSRRRSSTGSAAS